MKIEEIFKQVKEATIFKGEYMEAWIPYDYVEKNITCIIGNKVDTLGFFYLYVWDTVNYEEEKWSTKILYTLPSVFRSCPSVISQKTDEHKNKYLILHYNKDDKFVENNVVKQDIGVASFFFHLMTNGSMPKEIPYDKINEYWNECNRINGMNLGTIEVIKEVIVCEIARDPTNENRPFRLLINEKKGVDMKSRKLANIMHLPQKNSAFAAMMSADPKHGITQAVNRKREGLGERQSDVEDAIK